MAFIDFANAAPASLPIAHSALFATPRGAARPVEEVRTPAPTTEVLSMLERRVVELAQTDGLDTLKPIRKRSWLMRLMLGSPPPSPVLANEQLEALRRLAVQSWHHGYTLPASALRDARDAGYDETQISAVVDMIGRARPPVRRLAA